MSIFKKLLTRKSWLNVPRAATVLLLVAVGVIVMFTLAVTFGLNLNGVIFLELIAGVVIGVFTYKWVHKK